MDPTYRLSLAPLTLATDMAGYASTLDTDPLLQTDVRATLSYDERISLSYKRARHILNAHSKLVQDVFLVVNINASTGLTVWDVLSYGPKFWDMHLDMNLPNDGGAFTILTVNVNLAAGTIARFLDTRPDLEPLVESMLRLDTVGLYLLSERGHGLDVFNLETTATKVKGGFVLNTPREEAEKFVAITSYIYAQL